MSSREPRRPDVDQRIPNHLPSLRCLPERVSGMPVLRAMRRFAAVMPSARFHENVRPGKSFMVASVEVDVERLAFELLAEGLLRQVRERGETQQALEA